MFDFLGGIFAPLREVLHLGAYSGVALGLLAGLVALVYFDPLLRPWAIRIGILVIVGYALVIFAYHSGASDVRAQWQAAEVRAAAAAQARDADTARATAEEYAPEIATRDEMIAKLNATVQAYETQLSQSKSKCAVGNHNPFVRPVPRSRVAPTRAETSACRADALRLCSFSALSRASTGDNKGVIACLVANQGLLSKPCGAIIRAHGDSR